MERVVGSLHRRQRQQPSNDLVHGRRQLRRQRLRGRRQRAVAPVQQADGAAGRGVAQRRGAQAGQVQFRQCQARQNAYSQALAHHAGCGAHVGDVVAQGGGRRAGFLAHRAVELLARIGALRQQDQVVAQHVAPMQRAAFSVQAVAFGVDGAKAILGQRRERQVRRRLGQRADGELDLVGAQHGHQLVVVGLDHPHFQCRMQLTQRADRHRQQRQRGRGQGAQRHVAAPHRRQVRQAAIGFFQVGDGALRAGIEVLPGRGQADAAGGALEQSQAQHVLQVLDQRGEGRLRHAQLAGGVGERTGIHR